MREVDHIFHTWDQNLALISQGLQNSHDSFVSGRRQYARYMYYAGVREVYELANAGDALYADLEANFYAQEQVGHHQGYLTKSGRAPSWPTKHTWVDYREKKDEATGLVDVHILFRHRARNVYSQFRIQSENPDPLDLVWQAFTKWTDKKLRPMPAGLEQSAQEWLEIKHWREKCEQIQNSIRRTRVYLEAKTTLSQIGFSEFYKQVKKAQETGQACVGDLKKILIQKQKVTHPDPGHVLYVQYMERWSHQPKKFASGPDVADQMWHWIMQRPMRGWAAWLLDGKPLPELNINLAAHQY